MPRRLNYPYNFISKELDEISQCPATPRVAADARCLRHHFHVAWLPDAGASNERSPCAFRTAWNTWLLRLCFGGAGAFWRGVAAAGTVHARCGVVAGDRDGVADVEGVYAT